MKRAILLSRVVLVVLSLGLASQASAARRDPAEVVLTQAFSAALKNDFKSYLALVAANEKASPQQVSQLERYTFGRFARQVSWYISGNDPESFQVERREELGGGKFRYFLKDLAHPSRAPVPVALEQTPAGFVILSNSL